MNISVYAGGRPPFAFFEEKSVEDRPASEAAGCLKYKSIDMVTLSQPGSKDTIEKEAASWLESLPKNLAMKREWVEDYKRQYQAWKEGREITPHGTHVRMWPGANTAEADTLINAKIRTVEDLAAANEETLRVIGIGARALQQRARTFLETANDTGKVANEVGALRVTAASQAEQIKKLSDQIQALLAQLPKQPASTPAEDVFG